MQVPSLFPAPLTTLRLSPLASLSHPLLHATTWYTWVAMFRFVTCYSAALLSPRGGGIVVTHRYRFGRSGGRFSRPCRARRRGLEAVEGPGVGRAREGMT